MKIIRSFIVALAALYAAPALAQSGCESIVPGAILTAAQWNACFAAKQDFVAPPPDTTTQIITTGDVVVLCQDSTIILNKTAPAATAVTLPSVTCRFGTDGKPIGLAIYDYGGNAGNITITPSSGEEIMGASSKVVASGGSLLMVPNLSLTGWLVR